MHTVEMRSYSEMEREFIARFRKGTDAVKLERNMLLVKNGPAYAVRLFETDVVTYYPDDTFKISNGGWNTPTTIRALERYGPRGWRFLHVDRALVGMHGETLALVREGERAPCN